MPSKADLGVPAGDFIRSFFPSPAGFFVVSAEGRLFQHIPDPKNFSGRDQERFIWSEHKTPGPVSLMCLTPKNEMVLLLKDGSLVVRERSRANPNVVEWNWKPIPSPLDDEQLPV